MPTTEVLLTPLFPIAIPTWALRAITAVSAHEGDFGSCQQNLDGAGLSYGILQWTQKSGSLGQLLRAVEARAPNHLHTLFGCDAPELLAAAEARNLAPVAGALLWKEPWLSRFRQAATDGQMRSAQLATAARGEHMRGALDAARILGVPSEVGVAICFDRAVQQGPAAARKAAANLAKWYAADSSRRPGRPRDVLAQFAWSCAAKFRRTSKPATGRWVRVDDEYSELKADGRYNVHKVPATAWHLCVGPAQNPWSLYDLVVRRAGRILRDRSLSDDLVDVTVLG